jgi:hypothetical protein
MMPNHSKERDEAEARFKRAQKATQDPTEARAPYEAEAWAVREKTTKLKALRLARRRPTCGPEVTRNPSLPKRRPQFKSVDQ